MAIITCVSAQSGRVETLVAFKTLEHDFGEIKETDGSVTYLFEFTNTGKEPYVIVNISSSCGCTTSEYTREPVLPGKKGTVKAVFDPRNQRGRFTKKIYVTGNTGNTVELTIKGTVIPRPRTVEEDYPVALGNALRASAPEILLGMVAQDENHIQTIQLYNNSTKEVRLSAVLALRNPYMTVSVSPETLKPKEQGQIIFSLDLTGVSNVWGDINNSIILSVNGIKHYHPFPVRGIAVENFLRANGINLFEDAPVSLYSGQHFFFKDVKAADKPTCQIEIRNEGNAPLILHKIEPGSDRVTYKIDKTRVEKGEKAVLTLFLNPAGMKGDMLETVTIIQNDPAHPVKKIRLTVNMDR